jgi:hypothetical protein
MSKFALVGTDTKIVDVTSPLDQLRPSPLLRGSMSVSACLQQSLPSWAGIRPKSPQPTSSGADFPLPSLNRALAHWPILGLRVPIAFFVNRET